MGYFNGNTMPGVLQIIDYVCTQRAYLLCKILTGPFNMN
jgi:hypothetical protein